MIDREKVIEGLEWVIVLFSNYERHAMGDEEMQSLNDAIVLLKAQEPKPPVITENAYGWKFYHCPKCGREFYTDRLHGRVNAVKFCDKCGQAVKWDG